MTFKSRFQWPVFLTIAATVALLCLAGPPAARRSWTTSRLPTAAQH